MARVYKRGRAYGIDTVAADGTRERRIIGDKAAATAALSEVAKGGRIKKITPENFAAEYIEHLRASGKKQNTIYQAQSALKKILVGISSLQDMTAARIDTLCHEWQAAGNKGQTINLVLDRAKGIFDFAIDRGYAKANPFLSAARHNEDDPRPRRDLSPDEVRALLAAAEGEYRARWAVLLYSGLRGDNAASLRWDWIDFARHTLTIPRSEFKTNRDTVIPLHPTLAAILQEWQATGSWKGETVFPSKTLAAIRRKLERDCKTAGIDTEGVDLHALRHTFASALLNAGTPIEQISRLLGHKNIETTQRYLHWDQAALAGGLDKLPY